MTPQRQANEGEAVTTLHQRERLAGPFTTPSLAALTNLFGRLNAEHIVYCHWKSNEHLRAAMAGDTDLDLLVDRRATLQFTRILAEAGFKRFTAVPQRAYPGIEDHLGMDERTGKLIHLHVHYQLTLGEKGLKGYRLPWEHLVLSSRVLDDQAEIYIADPNVEFLLLIVRAALKLRVRDMLLPGGLRSAFTGSVLRELAWLRDRVVEDRLFGYARGLVGVAAARLLLEMTSGPPPSIHQLLALRGCTEPSLREYRMYSAVEALRRRLIREMSRHWRNSMRRYFHTSHPSKRMLSQGGVIAAFVGPDGSGKSTLTREVGRWLSVKLDVVPIYMGSGKGSASLPRRLLQSLASLVRPHMPAVRSGFATPLTGATPPRGQASSRLRRIGKILWQTALAHERRRRLRLARRARDRGMVVICDRYPQRQFSGFNDGPGMSHLLDHRSWAVRAAARAELAAMRTAELQRPDLVIKLHVTMDVASQRRPNTPGEQLRRKMEAVCRLQYPPATRVVDIDATQPIEHVVLQVKRAVWEVV
jgi:thymidylate kinase